MIHSLKLATFVIFAGHNFDVYLNTHPRNDSPDKNCVKIHGNYGKLFGTQHFYLVPRLPTQIRLTRLNYQFFCKNSDGLCSLF